MWRVINTDSLFTIVDSSGKVIASFVDCELLTKIITEHNAELNLKEVALHFVKIAANDLPPTIGEMSRYVGIELKDARSYDSMLIRAKATAKRAYEYARIFLEQGC